MRYLWITCLVLCASLASAHPSATGPSAGGGGGGGGGGAPTGSAGGELGGTYPNPTVDGVTSPAASPSVTDAGKIQCDSDTAGLCYVGDGSDERMLDGQKTVDWNPSPAGGTSTAGLAEAITEATALGGGIIQMRCDGASTYTITASASPAIALSSNIHIRGCGPDTPLTFDLTNAAAGSFVGLLLEDDADVTVQWLSIDWNENCTGCNATQSGQVISVQEGTSNVRLIENTIDIDDDQGTSDAATRGIWVTDSAESGDQKEPRNILIQGNTIHQTGRSAIEVSYGEGVRVIGNTIDFTNRPTANTAAGYGILFHECQGCVARGNVVDVGTLADNTGALANTINCFGLIEKSNATDADGNNSGRMLAGNACRKMWTGTVGVTLSGGGGDIISGNVFQAGRCFDTTGSSELFQGCYSDEDCSGLGGTTPICRNAAPTGIACNADDTNEIGGPRNILISGNLFTAGQGQQDGSAEEWDGGWADELIDIQTSGTPDTTQCSDITIVNNRAIQTTSGGGVTNTLDFINWESGAQGRNLARDNFWVGQFQGVSPIEGSIALKGTAEAPADVTGYGQLWYDSDDDGLKFTDESGNDHDFGGRTHKAVQIIIPDPDPAADEFVLRLPPWAGTLTRVDCEAYGGTSVTINICDGEDIGDDTCATSILDSTASTTLTCTTSGASDTALNATGFAARDKISIVLTAESGSVDSLEIYLTATED